MDRLPRRSESGRVRLNLKTRYASQEPGAGIASLSRLPQSPCGRFQQRARLLGAEGITEQFFEGNAILVTVVLRLDVLRFCKLIQGYHVVRGNAMNWPILQIIERASKNEMVTR